MKLWQLVEARWDVVLRYMKIIHCVNFIQGVSLLMDITAEDDFLGVCDKKSSYKHVSDFLRLRSYGRLKLRIESKDYWKWMEKSNKQILYRTLTSDRFALDSKDRFSWRASSCFLYSQCFVIQGEVNCISDWYTYIYIYIYIYIYTHTHIVWVILKTISFRETNLLRHNRCKWRALFPIQVVVKQIITPYFFSTPTKCTRWFKYDRDWFFFL